MNRTAVTEAPPPVTTEPAIAPADMVTYYDRPVIKEPVWIWTIPLYFFVGGIAGAAMILGAAAQLLGGRRLRAFARTNHWIGVIGGTASAGLLIADLGRPSRFLMMLRVLRPTSPMSVGSWVLALATPCSGAAALFSEERGLAGSLARVSGIGAALFGMPLATYTAVLITNSTVPVWLATRKSLPVLFGASSASALASLLKLLPAGPREQAIAHRFGIAGQVADVVATHVVESAASQIPRVGSPLRHGFSGALWSASKALTLASLALTLLPGRNRTRSRIAGVLGLGGSLALRFGIFYAGKASAADPRASFQQQSPQLPSKN